MKTQILIALVLLSTGVCSAQVGEDLYEHASRSTVRLVEIVTADTLRSAGTASFMVFHETGFLVTARHVAESADTLIALVTLFDESAKDYGPHLIRIPRECWVFHPQDSTIDTHFVDVAVCRIEDKPGFVISAFAPSALNQRQRPSILEPVLIFGYPVGENGNLFQASLRMPLQKPLARSGVVSAEAGEAYWVKDVRGTAKRLDSTTMMLDMTALPGYSGSPLIAVEQANGRPEILGLVIAVDCVDGFSFCEPTLRIAQALEYAIAKPAISRCIPRWD